MTVFQWIVIGILAANNLFLMRSNRSLRNQLFDAREVLKIQAGWLTIYRAERAQSKEKGKRANADVDR